MYALCLHCCDKPGVVAAVATTLCNANCNIEESAQFNDRLSGQFFMRVVFSSLSENAREDFEALFDKTAGNFDMQWQIHDLSKPVKTLILVSKADHCLNDLLYRWRTKHLNIDIKCVASNHETNRQLVEDRGIPYEHCSVSSENKAGQEQKISEIVEKNDAELIVLARYMQILSEDICQKYSGRIINIHHSFLPGFKGARPYHQAYERGVKIIGATAHFATQTLDEGPIIEQDTVRISHADTPKKLQLIGRDTEARVLARALQLYTERRVFLHGDRTVIL